MAPSRYLGAALRAHRERLGLTLRAVESRTGISNSYLSQLEGGAVRQPSPKHLLQLAEAYGASYEDLMTLAGYVPPPASSTRLSRSLAGVDELTDREFAQVQDFVRFLRSNREETG